MTRSAIARAAMYGLLVLLSWISPNAALAQAIPAPTSSTAVAASTAGGIAFGAAGSFATANSGNVTPGLPAGTANNDILICIVESFDNVVPTMPAGWTQLNTGNGGSATHQATIFWKRAALPEAAAVVTHTGGSSIGARIIRFSGVDTVTAFDVANSFTFSAADLTTEAAAITTVTNGTMLVFAAMMRDNHASLGAPTGAATVGWTQAFFSAFNGPGAADLSIGAYYGFADVAATYGPLQATRTGGANVVSHGALLALRPAAVAANLTITAPAGTVADSVMIASIAVRPRTAAVVPPAGWTLVRRLNNANATANSLAIFRKVAGAEPGSYGWFISTSTGVVGSILRFQNVDTTTPIDVETGQNTPNGTVHSTPGPPGPSTTVQDTMLVTSHAFASAQTWTPTAPLNEVVDIRSTAIGGGGISMSVNQTTQAAIGATGAFTSTAGGNADVGNAHILALRPRVHHFSISLTNSPDTCIAATLTITAQDASNNTVTNYTGTINLSTSTAHGTWGPGSSPAPSGTLTDSTPDDGAATYTFASGDAGVVKLTLTNVHDDDLTVTVVDNTRASTSTTSGTIQMRGNFFLIANDTLQIAGKDQTMSATLKQGSACPSTLTGYTGSKDLKVWYTADADHPAGASAPSIAGMTGPPLGTSVPGANNLTLTFTSGVSANFSLVTTDVGKYVINMRDDSQTFASNNLNGSSPTITTRPFALAFPGIQHSASESGTFLAKAGTGFSATVAAYLWQAADDADSNGVPDAGANVTNNGLTPRFAWSVTISADTSLPSPGTTGTLTRSGSAATIAQGSFSGGSATISDLEYSEVGNVTLIATASNYLNTAGATVGGSGNGNSGLDGTGAAGGYVGRFTPSRFALTPSGTSGPTLVNRNNIAACADAATTGTVGAGSTALTVASGTGFSTGDTIVVVGAGPSGIDLVTTATVSGTSFTLGTAASTAVTDTPVRKIGYSYMGDPIKLTFRLTAQNASGVTTQNYAGVYAKLNLGSAASFGLGAVDGATNLSTRLDTGVASSGSWSSGAADVTATTALKRASPDNPDGPYDTLRIGIAPDDNDPSGNGTRLASFNLDVNGDATNEHASVGTTRARFGRLRVLNAVGSEAIDLAVPMEAQYWTASAFATNTLDSCTVLNQDNIALDNYSGAVNPGAGNCKTYVNNAPITLAAGLGTIKFAAPSVSGSLRLTPRLGALGSPTDYCVNAASPPTAGSNATLTGLLGRWNDGSNPDGDANTSYDDNPAGRAAFGLYGSQPRNFIFFRENY